MEALVSLEDKEGLRKWIEKGESLEKAIFYAIKEDRVSVVSFLLKWEREEKEGNEKEEKRGEEKSYLEHAVGISLTLKRRKRNEGKERREEGRENEMIETVLLHSQPSFIALQNSLLLASSQARLDIIKRIVEYGEEKGMKMNINCKDSENENSPLLLSSLFHNLDLTCIEYLVNQGADVNLVNKQGNNCLHRIASKPTMSSSSFQVVQYLISKGINLHDKNNQGDTPLIKASRQGNEKLARIILQHSSESQLSIQNHAGYTAMHEAAIWCQFHILLLFLSFFPNSLLVCNERGDTLLHVAGDEDLVGPGFYRGGIKLNPLNQLDSCPPLNPSSSSSMEASGALLQSVQLLLSQGVSPSSLNKFKESPIYNVKGPWEKTALLLSQFEDPFPLLIQPNIDLISPFQHAFQLLKLDHIDRILKLVSGKGEEEIDEESEKVKELVQTVEGNAQFSAFLRKSCSQESYYHLSKLFLQKGKGSWCINEGDENGMTCLHFAVMDNALQTLSLLLELGGNPNLLAHLPSKNSFDLDPNVIDKILLAFHNGEGKEEAEEEKEELRVKGRKGEEERRKVTVFQMALNFYAIESALKILCFKYKDASLAKMSEEAEEMRRVVDSSGNNFLHRTVANGSFDALRSLILYAGMDPNSVGEDMNAYSDGGSPLHTAAQTDQIECAKVLIENGGDVNSQLNFETNTPLHLAARFGNFESVLLLLEKGADPTRLNSDGDDPLTMAQYGGDEKCCQIPSEAVDRFNKNKS